MTSSDVHDSSARVWQKIYAPVAVGAALIALAVGWWLSPMRTTVERPAATGQVGVLEVYAQTRRGPQRMFPSRGGTFERPQDIAFQFVVEGTGPRWIRLELENPIAENKVVLYEDTHAAPADVEPLNYVLHLDENVPDRLDLIVTVESPHMLAAVSRFPILLVGGNTRYWETTTATPSAPAPPAPAAQP